MQKQYASIETTMIDQTALPGTQPAEQDSSAIRAWSGTEDAQEQTGHVQADASAIASLSGSAFVFDDSWLGKVTEASSLNGGLMMVDFTAAPESVSAALSGHAAEGVLAGVTDSIPVWSLSHDDFGSF